MLHDGDVVAFVVSGPDLGAWAGLCLDAYSFGAFGEAEASEEEDVGL
jgi:hypothetical protein